MTNKKRKTIMIAKLKTYIECKIHNQVRKALFDWPLDFGLETAVMNNAFGDYHEFGVFEGRSFSRSALAFLRQLPKDEAAKINFWAYDSFEGLPETNDKYAPAHFKKGAYAAAEELFLGNVTAAGVPRERIHTVKGFYDKTLTPELAAKVFAERKIATTYIDCDIYESAKPIFEFITTGLQVGSVIVIDDWVRHHTHPNHGMQRAFNEWLARHPNIKVNQIALSKRICFVVYEV